MSPTSTTTRAAAVRTRAPAGRRPAGRRRGPARRGARGSDNWIPLVVVGVLVVVVVAWARTAESPRSLAYCTVPQTSMTLSPEQLENARVIAQVGVDRGLPERAIVIALATAQQESSLRNLDHGDRDSLGLFQQRPSQGWGTPEQVRDPVYAAGKFYDGLVQVPGWESGRLTDVAQTVQRSAFPEAYQKHESMAQGLTAALAVDSVDCS